MTATPVPATAGRSRSARRRCPRTAGPAHAATIASNPMPTPRALPIARDNAHTPIATTGRPVNIDAPRNDRPVSLRISLINELIIRWNDNAVRHHEAARRAHRHCLRDGFRIDQHEVSAHAGGKAVAREAACALTSCMSGELKGVHASRMPSLPPNSVTPTARDSRHGGTLTDAGAVVSSATFSGARSVLAAPHDAHRATRRGRTHDSRPRVPDSRALRRDRAADRS